MALDDVLVAIDHDLDNSLDRLFAFLRIPSISTDPAYRSQCRAAADWLTVELNALGFEAAVHATAGQPMVVAHARGGPGARGPHVLFYGHYDVQPPDPLDLWDSPPFEPVIKKTKVHPKGAIFARGSCDDKGQTYMHVKAFEAMVKTDSLPCNVKFCIEGEEEIGSPSF
ncbi:MAG: M20/M25/M40 family metallo-hydrolase, partial [Xanthobacteraceae bacterium]|nr:M20/M25/M40 family metallo-hydrolase [Xanthobacteraceae bacterium]